jgi:pimeloyl-ACP methyl ester carboxylesterase
VADCSTIFGPLKPRGSRSSHEQRGTQKNWPDRAFRLDLASADAIIAFNSLDYARALGDKALLLIGVDEDGLTSYDHTVDLFAAASGPKQLITLSGMTHHDIYQPQQRDGLMTQVLQFLQQNVAS